MDNYFNKKDADNLRKVFTVLKIVGAILMPFSMFLPFVKGDIGSYKNLSLIDYTRLVLEHSKEYTGSDFLGKMILILVSLIGIFSVLNLLFSLFSYKSNPTKTIVFTVLAGLVFLVLRWDFIDRGVIGEYGLKWDIAYYIFIIGTLISLAGSIVILVYDKKNKKTKEAQNEEEQK